MSKKSKRAAPPPKAPVEVPGAGFGGLGQLLAAQGLAPSAPAPSPIASSPPPAPSPPAAGDLSGKAVVRQERKGRGGKTVTVIDGAAIARVRDLESFAKTLRKAMGTGGRVENGQIVLQGDQRSGAAAWLEGRGATVVIGN